MIIDSLDNLERYIAIHPKFEKVFTYLRSLDLNLLEVGRLCVDEDFYINIDYVDMRPLEMAYPEIHYDYLDIQIPLTATEKMAYATTSEKFTLRESKPGNDIAFFQEIPDSILKVQPGQFVIFFPQEFHSPIIGDGKIKKVVVKVKY
jgi:YhcH/YjgK/YiaL family protein